VGSYGCHTFDSSSLHQDDEGEAYQLVDSVHTCSSSAEYGTAKILKGLARRTELEDVQQRLDYLKMTTDVIHDAHSGLDVVQGEETRVDGNESGINTGVHSSLSFPMRTLALFSDDVLK
jgi:hypothetical protein